MIKQIKKLHMVADFCIISNRGIGIYLLPDDSFCGIEAQLIRHDAHVLIGNENVTTPIIPVEKSLIFTTSSQKIHITNWRLTFKIPLRNLHMVTQITKTKMDMVRIKDNDNVFEKDYLYNTINDVYIMHRITLPLNAEISQSRIKIIYSTYII